MKAAGHLEELERSPAVGLLTPYTGGNLGDTAIQEAVIQGLRRRWPQAELVGITLTPERTEEVHGIPCIALSGLKRPRRSRPEPVGPQRTVEQLKERFRSHRVAFALARAAYRLAGSAMRLVRLSLRDFGHTLEVWKAARSLDIVVVSGGGQLDEYWGGPWGQPYALFKWATLTRVAGGRLVFLSVGTHALESRLSRWFVRRALQRSDYRSFRDAVSKRLAQDLGARASDPVVPDLAFSFRDTTPRSAGGGQETVIGVSPIAYLSPRSWPRHDDVAYRRHIGALSDFVAEAVNAGCRVSLFTSDECDLEALDGLRGELERRLGHSIVRSRIASVSTSSLRLLLDVIHGSDCVVASRLHGIILSHLLLVPALALSYDRKVDTYMADLGMQEFRLDIQGFAGGDVTERLRRLLANKQRVRTTLRKLVEQSREELDSQYDRVFGKTAVDAGSAVTRHA